MKDSNKNWKEEKYIPIPEVSKAPESDLRNEVLKGTKTAIWCNDHKEWKKVTEIMGVKDWSYDSFKPIVCLDDKSRISEFSSICKKYKIIPASQFIAANSESDKGEVRNEDVINDLAIEMLAVLHKVIHAIQNSNMKGTVLHSEITAVVKKAMNSPLKIKHRG